MSIWNTFFYSPKDVKLLWLSAFFRLTAFGASNISLTVFLMSLNVSETSVGIFMTTTLIGDTIISYILTCYADSLGRRNVMLFGSLLMCASGFVFYYSSNFYILLIAAILGVISPTGDEIGPFKSIEESSLAHLTSLDQRPDVYALHWLVSCAGSAFGTLSTGILVQYLQDNYWKPVDSYRIIFLEYCLIAGLKSTIMLNLSDKVENIHFEHVSIIENESTPLLNQIEEEETTTNKLSKETVHVLSRLLIVFMLDSFANGFMPSTWLIYYFKIHFNLIPKILGYLFFATGVVNSISSLPSSFLAKKFGPIKSTLLVQIPSGLFSLSIPLIAKDNFILASVFVIAYYSTTAMDVVPRQILLTNLIPPKDLTKSMGVVNIGKTFARCWGPGIIGHLASDGKLWYGFVIAGGLTLVADGLLFMMFKHVDEIFKNEIK